MSSHQPYQDDTDHDTARARLGRVFFETPNHLQNLRRELSSGDEERFRHEVRALRRLSEDSGDMLLVRLCEDLAGGDPAASGAADLIGEIEGRFVALWEDVGRTLDAD